MTNNPSILFTAQALAGSSPVFISQGKYITLLSSGVFNGASLTVDVSADGTTWVPAGVSVTAAGVANFLLGQGLKVRLTLGSVGASTSVTAAVAFEV